MRRKRYTLAAVLLTALVAATSASSRPAAGINVSAAKVLVQLDRMDQASGVASLYFTTSAEWSPDALREDVLVTIRNLTQGGESQVSFGEGGRALHSSSTYRGYAQAFEGDRIAVWAKWHVYTPTSPGTTPVDGEKTSEPSRYVVPKKELIPRWDERSKNRDRETANKYYVLCAAQLAAGTVLAVTGVGTAAGLALMVYSSVTCGMGYAFEKMAQDPVDLRFRVVAKPTPPVFPKMVAGQGLPEEAAQAADAVLAVQAREIGLARAMLTAFDRSQGAHAKQAVAWEIKQVQAAGRYARQLAAALLAEARLIPTLKASLARSDLALASLTPGEASAFGESLVLKGLPARFTPILGKVGLTKTAQQELRARLAFVDPALYSGSLLRAIADPERSAAMRQLAASLKAFSRRAAKRPLETHIP